MQMTENKCAKCKEPADGNTYCKESEAFKFCKLCSEIIETFPPGGWHSFLDEGQIAKNIIEARRKRLKGESPFRKILKIN